jgi:hypothetical protein
MSVLYNLTSLSAVKILWKFLELAQYNTGVVLVPSNIKKPLISELNISESIYNKSLVILKTADIISGDRGQYIINPKIHWRGDYKTREQLLKSGLKMTLEPDENFI